MGFFQKLKNSVYNFKAYKTFLAQSAGKAVLYIFLLSIILGSISNVKSIFFLNSGINSLETSVKGNFPKVTMAGGKLSVDSDKLIRYVDNDSIFIVDTTGKTDKSALDNYSKGFLATQDELFYKESDYKTETISLSTMPDMEFREDNIISFLNIAKKVLYVAIVVFVPLFYFLGKLLSAVIIFGLGGLALSAIMKANLTYGDCVKLGLYAITVPFLLKTLLSLIGLNIPGFAFIYYIVGLVYLGFAIKEITNTPVEPTEVTI